MARKARQKTRSKRWILLPAALAVAALAVWAWLGIDTASAPGARDADRTKAPTQASLPSKDTKGVEVRSHIDRKSRDALEDILAGSGDEEGGD